MSIFRDSYSDLYLNFSTYTLQNKHQKWVLLPSEARNTSIIHHHGTLGSIVYAKYANFPTLPECWNCSLTTWDHESSPWSSTATTTKIRPNFMFMKCKVHYPTGDFWGTTSNKLCSIRYQSQNALSLPMYRLKELKHANVGIVITFIQLFVVHVFTKD